MKTLHVAVAVIMNAQYEVLIALRQSHQELAGLWEFPGGKVEQGEATRDALKREVQEELALTVVTATPLLKVTHNYGEKSVLLDVWHVQDYVGYAQGAEGQTIRWCARHDLSKVDFPDANKTIIDAINALTI